MIKNMKDVNVMNKKFYEAELLGIRALYTELHTDKSSIPDGMYCYDLRHGDDDSFPSAVENSVAVNYYGTILTTEKLNFGTEDFLPIDCDSFGFTGEIFCPKDFLKKSKLQNRESCGPEDY
jgi:hypothetical protein